MGRLRIADKDKELNQYIGKRIREYIKFKGLSIYDVAEKLNVSANQVFIYVRGDGDIRISQLLRISKVLEIPVVELLPEDTSCKQLSSSILELLNTIEKKKLNPDRILDIEKNLPEEDLK